MTEREPGEGPGADSWRYGRDSQEFARVVNLSDALFAIAMTLLVLTLDVPAVPAGELAAALVGTLPQLIAFLLSFTLVASVWWAHHRFFALLGSIEPGLVALNLLVLGTVALVPFPTSLIGATPTTGAAVLPFIVVFVVIHVLFLSMVLRAQAVQAWRWPVPEGVYPWLVWGWLAHIATMLAALLLAVGSPLAGLVVAAVSGPLVGVTLVRMAPAAYSQWS